MQLLSISTSCAGFFPRGQYHTRNENKTQTLTLISYIKIPMNHVSKVSYTYNLREPQHTPRAYPMNPQTPKWKEFLHKLFVGGLGYVPRVFTMVGPIWAIWSYRVWPDMPNNFFCKANTALNKRKHVDREIHLAKNIHKILIKFHWLAFLQIFFCFVTFHT